ncbi:MAG: NADPH-dependent glutamate synthase [bacterium]
MAKVIPTKTKMQEQLPRRRIKNFEEVPFGYSEEQAIAEAQRCLQCKKPFCISGCPVEIDIPAFIELIAEGDFLGAVKKIKEKNMLPAVCGRVCPQEEQCEAECALAKKFESVGIGRLERFAADWEAANCDIEIPPKAPPTGKRIAVVGAGPAGLTVAGDLLLLGHEVTIFEALHEAGGVLIYGIPEFRLPKSVVKREVEYVCKLGAKLYTDYVIGKILSVDELLDEFDAVFIGTGAGLPWFMKVPGENLNGIYSANEYLTRTNLMKAYQFPREDTPIEKGRKVAVIGGGNVAMDAARTALRLGAEKSIIVYRRSRTEMPAREEEIHHAEQEGVIFELLTNPVAYRSNGNGWVQEMECIRNRLGEPDASGRRRPVPIEGSHFRTPIDVVVVAIGNSPNPLIAAATPGLEVEKHGNLKTDLETGKTTKVGVFAGGDVATGAATVIQAMGAGKKAARAIDEYLRTGAW